MSEPSHSHYISPLEIATLLAHNPHIVALYTTLWDGRREGEVFAKVRLIRPLYHSADGEPYTLRVNDGSAFSFSPAELGLEWRQEVG